MKGRAPWLELVPWAIMAVAVAAVSVLRPRAAAAFHQVRVTADIYPLPPPEKLIVASLGYRSALADYIFANTLVSYGLHLKEKRRFEFAGDYLDAINALDPKFRDPYHFADTMLVFQPVPSTVEDYERAREILLRGIANRPSDTALFNQAGQFLVYMAAPNLPKALGAKYRLEGGHILARACELASDDPNAPYGCVTAAKILEESGKREAAIEAMKRLLAVTDDPEIEARALAYLRVKLSEREGERREHRKAVFHQAWKSDLPFVPKDAMLVIGPKVDTARCAGIEHADDPGCPATWREWARNADPAPTD